jgi:hypothetical protein
VFKKLGIKEYLEQRKKRKRYLKQEIKDSKKVELFLGIRARKDLNSLKNGREICPNLIKAKLLGIKARKCGHRNRNRICQKKERVDYLGILVRFVLKYLKLV